ncbi:hypothetical protein F5Y14DRAFT_318642 [Nemania sp. NC0429]|nr:hypothetical protein F5Y14DRAFT_318642 [Nemania sp. NC0429]
MQMPCRNMLSCLVLSHLYPFFTICCAVLCRVVQCHITPISTTHFVSLHIQTAWLLPLVLSFALSIHACSGWYSVPSAILNCPIRSAPHSNGLSSNWSPKLLASPWFV